MRVAGINATELLGGALAIAIGVFAVAEGVTYSTGTLTRMGPGFFPVLLGVLMICLGFAIAAEGRRADAEPPERPAVRSLVCVLAGIGAFGLLIERAGLVPASVALVVLSSIANPRLRPLETLILALAVSAFSVLVFAEALGLNLRSFAAR